MTGGSAASLQVEEVICPSNAQAESRGKEAVGGGKPSDRCFAPSAEEGALITDSVPQILGNADVRGSKPPSTEVRAQEGP